MFSLGSTLFGLLFAGAPIGIALAGATALLVLFDDFLTYSTLFEAFFSFLTKYTLVAIPFFIFAGFLMEKTGLVAGLFKFADAVVGWVPVDLLMLLYLQQFYLELFQVHRQQWLRQ